MALRNCTMLHVVAGSCMFRIIVQVASPFGDDSESKTQVNEQKNTPKLLKFRGIGRFVIPLCFQWLATFCNSMTSCALQLIVVGDFAMLTWDYFHSIVAIVLCVLPCVISCHLVRLFSSSPNHFVIRWVITNHRIPDSNADSCDDSLATIPDFVNGNSIGRFAVRRFGQNRHSYSLGDFL